MNIWKNIGIFAVSALSLGVVACSGSDGAPGPKGDTGAAGDKGDKGDPGDATPKSVGVIVPNIGLLDREMDVTITTNGVDLTKAAPTVDLGAGVTVSKIQVLSATTLYAHVAVDAGAATGARDAKVTAGSDSLTSTKGFTVAAPLQVTANPASVSQGDFVLVDVQNLDSQHAFDDASFLGSYTDFQLLVTDGTDEGGGPTNVTATRAEGFFLLAPQAAASVDVLAGNIDGFGQVTETYAGAPITVAARTPKTVTPGTDLTGENIAKAGGTNTYKFDSAAVAILEVTPTAVGAQASPVAAVYGNSGKADDLFTVGSSAIFPVPGGKSNYATVFDGNGGGGAIADFGFTMSVTTHTGTAFPEPATAHAGAATAAAITPALPASGSGNGVVVVGSSTTGTEADWYSLTLAQNDKLEISLVCDYDCSLDLTDSAGTTDELDNGQIESAPGRRLAYVVQTIAPAGSNTYKIQVVAPDQTSHGNYWIGLRKVP